MKILTEEQYIEDHEHVQVFLSEVREAYRKMIKAAHDKESVRYQAQDNLSLFSPYMNSNDES